MNTARYVSSNRGRCATQYVREDLDSILPGYSVFLYRDQQYTLPVTLDEPNPAGARSSKFAIPLGYGVYGLEPNGIYTLLASCVDSSD